MPLRATDICCSFAPVCRTDTHHRFSSSVTNFPNSVRRPRTQRVGRYDSPSGNSMLGSDEEQLGGRGKTFTRRIRNGSAWSVVVSHDFRSNCITVILQTRFCPSFKVDRKDAIVSASTSSGSLLPKMGSEEFHFRSDSLRSGRSPRLLPKSRGWVFRCSITAPVPNEHTHGDTTSETKGEKISYVESAVDETKSTAWEPVKAAFFDVDGTITRTNVVQAYLSVRMAELSFMKKLLWLPWFFLSCIVYLAVDRFHRPTFNRIFYLSYKGRQTEGKTATGNLVFEQYYKPRIMAEAVEQIQELKQLGYHIVFVTGALDFQIAPLARELGADFVYAAKLVEKDGRFTGELDGMGTSNIEKAERLWDYAKRFRVSLRDSLAFGDSIADIAMLEVVGKAYAVNPDARLEAVALRRGWPILNWCANNQTTAATVPI